MHFCLTFAIIVQLKYYSLRDKLVAQDYLCGFAIEISQLIPQWGVSVLFLMGNADYNCMWRPSVGTGPNFLQGNIPVTQAVSNIVASNSSILENIIILSSAAYVICAGFPWATEFFVQE